MNAGENPRDDFLREGLRLDEGRGPARPRSELELERMVQWALDDGLRPSTRRPRLGWASAAVLVLLLGPPAAWGAVEVWDRLLEPAFSRNKPKPSAEARPASSARTVEPEVAPVRAPEPSVPVEPDVTPSTLERTPPGLRENPGSSPEGPAPKAAEPRKRGHPRLSKRSRASSRRRSGPSAAALLGRASALRRDRAWGAAAEVYGRVRRTASKRAEIHVAAVAEGQLRLEHLGDPGAALVAFRAALRALPSGPLASEADLGVGDALFALGRTDEARIVWRRLRRDHPRSRAAAEAVARLEDTRR